MLHTTVLPEVWSILTLFSAQGLCKILKHLLDWLLPANRDPNHPDLISREYSQGKNPSVWMAKRKTNFTDPKLVAKLYYCFWSLSEREVKKSSSTQFEHRCIRIPDHLN